MSPRTPYRRSPRRPARRLHASWFGVPAVLLAGLVAAAMTGCAPAAGELPSSTSQPGHPSESDAIASSTASVIVTFLVAGAETFRVRLDEASDIAQAYGLLAGQGGPAIPNGRIVRGSNDVNIDHDWSIDPADFEFADLTMEVCDGLPSVVDDPSFSSDRYCPWSAEVIAVEPVSRN